MRIYRADRNVSRAVQKVHEKVFCKKTLKRTWINSLVYSFGEQVEHIREFFLYHQPWQIVSIAAEYYYSDF